MNFGDVSLVSLRVFREVADRGTFTAAAQALGYTQSAVSRQIASLERASGGPLLQRRREGVRLTPIGQVVLRRAADVIDQIDATARELSGLPPDGGTVRLGWFTSAGVALVPTAIAALRADHPAITVITRGATTPALVRALRAGSIDLAVLASAPPFRPPDSETPPLELETLAERTLLVAAPAAHPLARADSVGVAELRGQLWIAGPASGGESSMGVWPGIDERPQIAHTVSDWMAKLHLVAAGCGLTTLPASLAPAVPPGVKVLEVRGGPHEQRRLILARLPGAVAEPTARVAEALRFAATGTAQPAAFSAPSAASHSAMLRAERTDGL
jgi:DNA-binding transcriptional LysR family regulator